MITHVSDSLHAVFARGTARVFAHRGGAALAPENTCAAFDQGLALGADGLELDVRLSRDGVVMVHHDATLDRTTNGRGALADCTAAELARLDAGYWFGGPNGHPCRGRGMGIPQLADVLARYREVPIIIELKDDHAELVERTIAAVRAAGASGRVAIGSFQQRMLDAVRASAPDLPTGASTAEIRRVLWRSRLFWPVRQTLFRMIQVPEVRRGTRIVSPRLVRTVHGANLAVQVWTVNREDDMRRLLDWGVDAIITDRPDLAVGVVRSHPGTSYEACQS